MFRLFNNKAMPYVKEYSLVQVDKLITLIINSSVNKMISENDSLDNLIEVNEYDGVKSMDISSGEINKLIYDIASQIKKNLYNLENGNIENLNINLDEYNIKKIDKGVILNLPSGVFIDNIILANLMPNIPIKVNSLGDLACKLNPVVSEYGINNALITLYIDVSVSVKILFPFTSEMRTVSISIPILTKIIEGDVPIYYYGGYLNSNNT